MDKEQMLLEAYKNYYFKEFDGFPDTSIKILSIAHTEGLGDNEDYDIQISYDMVNGQVINTVSNGEISCTVLENYPITDMTETFNRCSFDDFIYDNPIDFDMLDEIASKFANDPKKSLGEYLIEVAKNYNYSAIKETTLEKV